MTDETETKRQTLSIKARFALPDIMKPVLTSMDGFAVYAEGWGDQRVLAALLEQLPGEQANIQHIRTIRRELFGSLKHPPPKAEASTMELGEAIGLLRAGITELRRQATEMRAYLDMRLDAQSHRLNRLETRDDAPLLPGLAAPAGSDLRGHSAAFEAGSRT